MNLLLIAEKLWRYKLATLPIIVFVLAGSYYALAVKEPVYEASSNYILLSPPPSPTADEVANNPELGDIGADNPYTRYSDQTVVVQVLASSLSGEETRRKLAERGADDGYAVEPAVELGLTAPILEITGTGPAPEIAVETAEIVGGALREELERMQTARGVDDEYMIETQQVVAPNNPKLKASAQLRTLVAVLAMGAILLFVVVSVADAFSTLRRRGWAVGERSRGPDEGGSGFASDSNTTPNLAALDMEDVSAQGPGTTPGRGRIDPFPASTLEANGSNGSRGASDRPTGEGSMPRP